MIDVDIQAMFALCKMSNVYRELYLPKSFSINIDLYISFPHSFYITLHWNIVYFFSIYQSGKV